MNRPGSFNWTSTNSVLDGPSAAAHSKNRSFFFAKLAQASVWCAAEEAGGAPFTGQKFGLRSS
jgi:hypothetical protein